ncbi:MAG TPA: YpiB family protein [Bacillota bacterium]|nr:YpiB family protein [Bacillota bacterium]HPT86630.1 YpiB family protein [Bacillota bacterium]
MTRKTVSSWAKRNFLHWFIENYPFDSEGSKQLLLLLADNEEYLSRIHLVMDGSYLRPLLVISTTGTGMPPFILKTFNSTVTDPEMIIARLQLLKESPLYLTLYFPDRLSCESFHTVIEESPVTLESTLGQQILIDFELSLWTEAFKREMEMNALMVQINEALDSRNKRKFLRLARKYNKL